MGQQLHVLEHYSQVVQSAPADLCCPVDYDPAPGNRWYSTYRVIDVAFAACLLFGVDSARLARWNYGG